MIKIEEYSLNMGTFFELEEGKTTDSGFEFFIDVSLDSNNGVFRRYHVGNNPVNFVDPLGLFWGSIITRGGGKGVLSGGPGALTGGIIGGFVGAGLGSATLIPGMGFVGGVALGWAGSQIGGLFDPPCAGQLNCNEPLPPEPPKPAKCH